MTEKCSGDVIFTVSATVPKIGGVFPKAIELDRQGELLDVVRDGVYIVNTGKVRIVGIKGVCPNVAFCERLVDTPCPISALINKI